MPQWIVIAVIFAIPVSAGVAVGLTPNWTGRHKFIWAAAAAPIPFYLLMGLIRGGQISLDVILILGAVALMWAAIGWASRKITKEVRDAVLDNMG